MAPAAGTSMQTLLQVLLTAMRELQMAAINPFR